MLTSQQALQRMKADMQLQGMSRHTFRTYLRNMEMFLEYCDRPIEEIDERDVRRYLGYLIVDKKLSPETVNVCSSSIRFFFAVTLNRTMNYLQIPRMRVSNTLPVILSREEVNVIINNCGNLKHRALLLLAYGSGLRVSELISLKVKDIDSKAMRVFVSGGKGNKDRYTLLSENALYALRDYWRRYRPKSPEGYLFPGMKNIGHLDPNTVARAIKRSQDGTGIAKNISPHTFRHAFATHLLEDGYGLLQIKELLGHACISSTTVYLHLANTTQGVTSPADSLHNYSSTTKPSRARRNRETLMDKFEDADL